MKHVRVNREMIWMQKKMDFLHYVHFVIQIKYICPQTSHYCNEEKNNVLLNCENEVLYIKAFK